MTTVAVKRPLPFAKSIANHPQLELLEFLVANLGVSKTARALNVSLDGLFRWRKHRLETDPFFFATRQPPSDHGDKATAARIIAENTCKQGVHK